MSSIFTIFSLPDLMSLSLNFPSFNSSPGMDVLSLILSVLSFVHVVLTKTDSRSAGMWTAITLLLPGLGAFLYWAIGINRVQRRAKLKLGKREKLENIYTLNASLKEIVDNFHYIDRIYSRNK